MKRIEFVSPEKCEIACAEDWLAGMGFKVDDVYRASRLDSGIGMKKIVRTSRGIVLSFDHDGRTGAVRYYTLSDFKQAILEDMETTTKTKEGNKVDYKDICIEFDTNEQAQVFAEAVHKMGHPINYWESKFYGDTIGISRASGVFSRHNSGVTRHDHCKHISEAPAEWLRFLLSPVRPPLKVAGHDVKITADSAKIGCTTVTWEEVKSVYEAMKAARS